MKSKKYRLNIAILFSLTIVITVINITSNLNTKVYAEEPHENCLIEVRHNCGVCYSLDEVNNGDRCPGCPWIKC